MNLVNDTIGFGLLQYNQPFIAEAVTVAGFALIGIHQAIKTKARKANPEHVLQLPDPFISENMNKEIKKSERRKSRAFWAGMIFLSSLGLNYADPTIQHSKKAQGNVIVIDDGLNNLSASTYQRIDNEITSVLSFAAKSKTPTTLINDGQITGQVTSSTKNNENFKVIKSNFQNNFDSSNPASSSILNQDLVIAKADDSKNNKNIIVVGGNLSSNVLSQIQSFSPSEEVLNIESSLANQNKSTAKDQITVADNIKSIDSGLEQLANTPLGKPTTARFNYFIDVALLAGAFGALSSIYNKFKQSISIYRQNKQEI